MIKNILFLFSFSLLLACTAVEDAEMSLQTSTQVLKTGDSLSFYTYHAQGDVTYGLMPNIGTLITTKYYVAPSTLLKDSTWVTLYAKTSTQTTSSKILLVKSQPTDSVISFAQIIQPLMVANCNFNGCHGNGSRAGNVELSSFDSAVKYVIPYQPNQSLLYTSLIKSDPLRRMPPAGPLHAYKINWVSKWIEQGANNN